MFDCYYYWMCAPLRGNFIDSPNRMGAFNVDINVAGMEHYSLSLFFDSNEEPDFLRVKIPNLPSKDHPESMHEMLNTIKQHVYSILRISFDSSFAFQEDVPHFRTFVEAGAAPDYTLEFSSERKKKSPHHLAQLFKDTFDAKQLINLYVDGADARIPTQYRYLSFYKVLELVYKERDDWDYENINPLLAMYATRFKKMGFNKSLFKTLLHMRDACAHIQTGKGVLGVTSLNHKETLLARRLLPLIQDICARVLNERLNGKCGLFLDPLE